MRCGCALVHRHPGAGVSMRVDVQAAPLSLLFGDFLEHCCGLAPPLGLCLGGVLRSPALGSHQEDSPQGTFPQRCSWSSCQVLGVGYSALGLLSAHRLGCMSFYFSVPRAQHRAGWEVDAWEGPAWWRRG